MQILRRTQLVVMVLFAAAVGCGDGIERKPVAATSGRVLCQGLPVANASVLFNPVSEGKSALVGKQGYANTNVNGEFVISTYGDRDGAVVGKHKVIVSDDSEVPCDCIAIDTHEVMEVEVKADSDNVIEVILPVKVDDQPVRQSSSDMEDED